jgi:hypothetical protein
VSAYFDFEAKGFNVVVVEASPQREVIVIQRITPDGQEPRNRPVYWGTDDLAALTPAEAAVVADLLPLAVRKVKVDPKPAPIPASNTSKAIVIACACIGLLVSSALILIAA